MQQVCYGVFFLEYVCRRAQRISGEACVHPIDEYPVFAAHAASADVAASKNRLGVDHGVPGMPGLPGCAL